MFSIPITLWHSCMHLHTELWTVIFFLYLAPLIFNPLCIVKVSEVYLNEQYLLVLCYLNWEIPVYLSAKVFWQLRGFRQNYKVNFCVFLRKGGGEGCAVFPKFWHKSLLMVIQFKVLTTNKHVFQILHHGFSPYLRFFSRCPTMRWILQWKPESNSFLLKRLLFEFLHKQTMQVDTIKTKSLLSISH